MVNTMRIILVFSLFLMSVSKEPCSEGTGYLTAKDIRLKCLWQHTYTTQGNLKGVLEYKLTIDSMVCTYYQEGEGTRQLRLVRTRDTEIEGALMHNEILTKTQYKE